MKAGGSAKPATHETVDAKEHSVWQDGQTVFKAAVTSMADVSEEIMKKTIYPLMMSLGLSPIKQIKE